MKKVKNSRVEFYQFELLNNFPELTHAVFTRRGGVSSGPFHSLNVSYHSGDDKNLVRRNRGRVKSIIGSMHLVSAHQVHEKRVKIIDRLPVKEEPEGFDALITSLPGVALMIKQADCQAVILYDPGKKVIGNVHCGWRGSILNIIGHTIQAMRDNFGSRPKDILAGVGPSLGPCCAEFKNFRQELSSSIWQYEVTPNHFDLWAVSRDQLLGAGLLPQHIEMAEMCTKCRPEDFFSYRREKLTGRFGTVVALSNGMVDQ